MNIKKRYWGTIVYPESVINDWIEILKGTGLKIAISPLHDKDLKEKEEDFNLDVNNEYGIYKKPHYHVLLCWDSPTTYNNVCVLTDKIKSSYPIPIESANGTYWYHIHRYEKDKPLYNDLDRILLNGLTPEDFENLTNEQQFELKEFITGLIEDNNLIRIYELKSYIHQMYFDIQGNEKEVNNGFSYRDCMRFIYNNGYFIKLYLDDIYKKLSKAQSLHDVLKVVSK